MKVCQRNICTLVLSAILLTSLAGCDQITAVKEKITSTVKQEPKGSTAAGQQAKQAKGSKTTAASKPLAKNVLVRVDSWTMSIEEFKERLNALKEMVPEYTPGDKEQDKLILQELINQQLLVQEAETQGIGNGEEIQKAVEEFRRTLLVQELARKMVEKVVVTEAEAQEFYEINRSDFIEPAQWKVREIVLDTEEEAKEVLIELYKGADFEVMAKTRSKGATASKGGGLGEISYFEFPKQGDIVSALEVGEISSIFKGPQGFYIVKLEDKKGGEQKSFDEIKEDIKAGLVMLKQQQEVMNYLKRLEEKANIEINEKLLD